jgi:hypothetical protein
MEAAEAKDEEETDQKPVASYRCNASGQAVKEGATHESCTVNVRSCATSELNSRVTSKEGVNKLRKSYTDYGIQPEVDAVHETHAQHTDTHHTPNPAHRKGR